MSGFVNHLWKQFMDEVSGWPGLIADITGFISVYYAVRNKILTWPWGIISVILFGWVFYALKNYANAYLQIFYYLPISFYGWYVWLRYGPKRNDDLPVTLLSLQERLGWVLLTVIGSVGYGFYLHHTDDPFPYSDATTTVISIVAQYLQVKKKFENWMLWIVADVIYAFYLFPMQKLMILALLYVLFLIMAFSGAAQWIKIMRGQNEIPEPIVKGYEAEAAQDE